MTVVRITRRQVLQSAALCAAWGGLGFATARSQAGPISVVAEATSSPLLGKGSPETQHWRLNFNGAGPVCRLRQGEDAQLRLSNTLAEDIWLHFFGVRGASTAMTVHLPAGAVQDLTITPPDAGTFWCGPLINASRQRDMGLYGMIVVEESGAQTAFADIPLILDDWKLNDDGTMQGAFGDLEAAAGEGRLGNWFTVNGKLKPTLALPADKPVRLRLLNAANTRTMNVTFKGADLAVLAWDGQPVKPQALGAEPLKLAPGQRADLAVLHAEAQVALALDLFEDVVEAAFLTANANQTAADMGSSALPANPLPVVDPTVAPRTVPLVLEGGLKGGLKSARVGAETLELRALVEKGLLWAINGMAGPGNAPLFEARRGEHLVLAVDNRTTFEQPLHVHGHVWHLVEQDGKVTEGQSWRDTAVVPPLSTAKLAMVADNPGSWAVQSLVAERCDSGLLAAFAVSDMP